VEVNGNRLRDKDWHGIRAQALLKAVIAHDGTAIPVTKLADMLWPDSDGDKSVNALKVTLYRLRRMVAGENGELGHWIYIKNRHVSLSKELCQVDAFEFENRIKSVLRTQTIEPYFIKKILKIYNGNFLEGQDDIPCIIYKRDNLLNLYIKAIWRLSDYFAEQQDYDESISILQHALRFDSLNESIYAKLMKFHFLAGNRAKALDIFSQAKKRLKKGLGIDPSNELIEMALKIRT
jgi:two-component SAPR family response regulator